MKAVRCAAATGFLFVAADLCAPARAAPPTNLETPTLAQKLAATSVRQPGADALSDWLRPIADNVVMTVCVLARPAPPTVLVPRPAAPFTVSQFLDRSNALGHTDADFFFWGDLTATSREQLSSRYLPRIQQLQRTGQLPTGWNYSTTTMHFEAIAYGRSRFNPDQVVFPGWAAHEIRFNDVPLTLTCAQAAQHDRCQPALANGILLTGRQVEVTGALVADCHGQTCSPLLELHPIYAIRTIGPCASKRGVR